MRCRGCNLIYQSGLRCECGLLLCERCLNTHPCGNAQPLWEHQKRGIELARQAQAEGHRAILVTAPCAAGKTRQMAEMIRQTTETGKPSILFTNRKILTRQASKTFSRQNIDHGVMAAGYHPQLASPVQVASLQTVNARVFERDIWNLPPASEVFIDEAHSCKQDMAQGVMRHYLDKGAAIFGFTATPVGLDKLYTKLLVSATNSELRKCGAIVPCHVFAPDEPDMKGVKFNKLGEYIQEGMRKRVMQCVVFADVFKHWRQLNPWGEPTLLFAPGVRESQWFVEEFRKLGIGAEHIDADTPEDERERIIQGSEEGGIQIISSYGVLREGADFPWIRHGILVQVCGALSTYLQLTGRLLRKYPGKDLAILQDHSGAYWRHGSPNIDRAWTLANTDKSLANALRKARQEGKATEPIRCPECGGIRSTGPVCPHCGHRHVRSVRMVRMTDGTLKRMVGNVVKHKNPQTEDQKAWLGCLYACAKARWPKTPRQAAGWFRTKTGHSVHAGLKPIPEPDSLDWDRAVRDVYPWLLRQRKVRP